MSYVIRMFPILDFSPFLTHGKITDVHFSRSEGMSSQLLNQIFCYGSCRFLYHPVFPERETYENILVKWKAWNQVVYRRLSLETETETIPVVSKLLERLPGGGKIPNLII